MWGSHHLPQSGFSGGYFKFFVWYFSFSFPFFVVFPCNVMSVVLRKQVAWSFIFKWETPCCKNNLFFFDLLKLRGE